MDDPRDEHTAVPTPAAARDRGRVVRALGSGAVWALGVFVVLVSLVTLGTILFSRRPEASRLAIEFVNRALAGASDLRLTAERTLLLEHGARIVHPRLAVIDSAGRAQTLLEAADLSIGTSWGGLLRGRPDAFLIDLREARLTLRRRPDGSLVLPRFRGTGRPPELDARLDLDIRSHGLTVLLLDGVAPAETLATGVEGVVRARQRGPRWEISLSGLRGRAPAAGLARAKVEGRALYSGGEFELTRLRIETDAGWIAGKGRGRVTPRLDLAGRVEVGEVTWTRLAHWTGQEALDLAGGIAGGFSWHARGDSLAIAGARFDVLWRNEPAAATFNGRWAAGRLALTDAAVVWRETAFRGRFDLDTGRRRGWALDGRLTGLDLATLPRLWPLPALDPSDLAGDIHLAGDEHGLAATVRRADGRWRELPIRDLQGTWSLAHGVQTVDLRTNAGGGVVAAAGTIGPGGLDLALAAGGIDAGALSAARWRELGVAPSPRGRVERLAARLLGPGGHVRAIGRAHLADVAMEAATLAVADVEFDGVLGHTLEGGLTIAARDARIGPARADTISALLSFTKGAILVEDLRAARGDSLLTVAGRAERRGRAWDVTVDRAAWDVGEALALETEGPLRFRLEPDGSIEVERAHILSNAGSFAASGTWGGAAAPSDLVLDLETLDLESMLAPFLPDAGARGIVTGHARVEGMGRNAVYTVDLEGRNLRWRRLDARRLLARGRFAREAWRIERLDLDTGRGRLHFAGDLEWAEPPPFDADVTAWNRALTAAPRWHGELAADSLAMDQIAAWFPEVGGWRGVLDLTFTLDGRPAAPLGRVVGVVRQPGWGQATLGDFAVDLDYRDEVVTVRRFAMAGPDSVGPLVAGTLPLRLGWGVTPADRLPDRPMAISVFARGLDLSLVPLVLPQIAAAGGGMDFAARLTGTPKTPLLNGAITLHRGIIRPASREEVLTDVEGRVALRGDQFVVERLTARQGKKGRLVVRPGGSATIKDLRIVAYDLDVDLESITAFASGEYVIVLGAKLNVANGLDYGGALPLPQITGTAHVEEGLFLYSFADPSRQQATQGPLVLPPWTYAIDVDADNNVWYRPTDANIEGRLTDFRVIQDTDRFLMLGEIEALRGRYYFLGNAFALVSGNLFFDAAQEMDPTVEAILTTEKLLPTSGIRETITLTVTGRALSPTVSLTSSPTALSQGEIVSLLTYGQLAGGGRAVVAAGSQYLARQLSREIPELEKYLGTVDVSESYSEGKDDYASEVFTTVGITRYFTSALLVRYSQVVGDVSQTAAVDYQDLAAEYRLNRLLILRGQVTRRRGTLVSSQDETIYNLDVRARHEY